MEAKLNIYPFGVVLFEIMCGHIEYDETYRDRGLLPITRQPFKKKTLYGLIDSKL